jgi:hypothetical protein
VIVWFIARISEVYTLKDLHSFLYAENQASASITVDAPKNPFENHK